MIDTMIADDDSRFREFLREVLLETGRVRVVAEAGDGLECLNLLERTRAELLLLDVAMPQLTGVEVAEVALRRANPPLVVFITGHQGYAVRAYELDAADYLVKPDDPRAFHSRVATMLDRVEDRLAHRRDAITELRQRVDAVVDAVARSSADGGAPRGRLPVKDYEQGTILLLATEEITHVERRNRQVLIHAGGKTYRTTQSVERLAARLEPEGFASISSGAIVNLKHIEHLIPNGDGSYDVQLSDRSKTILSASRQRSRLLLKRFGV
jgi:DNA-binding LytR/AlgR family response regulator